jgi:rfaE bifunctional protein nucleotidyltransferase chain/domain
MQNELIEKKIFQSKELVFHLLNQWRFQQKKIVFTNGCFDLLHKGHIDYLSKAADLGDLLIVGLNSDHSVSTIKGPKRPINDQIARAYLLASLFFVDTIILFNEDTPYELIKFIGPDVLVKGSDYKPEEIVGYDIVNNRGGKVKTIDFLPGYSTSGIEQTIVKNHTKG